MLQLAQAAPVLSHMSLACNIQAVKDFKGGTRAIA